MLREYKPIFRDVVALLAIPGVLVALHFFLPDTIRSQLVFTYGESGPFTAWTSAYLHASNGHLYDNLFGYAIPAAFTYYLYTAYLQQRRRFWIIVAVLLGITPFITTTIDYVVLYQYIGFIPIGYTSQGFSGIASAFSGVFLTAIGFIVANEYDSEVGIHTALLIFLISLGVLTVANGILSLPLATMLIFGFVLLSTQYISLSDLRYPSRLQYRVRKHDEAIFQIVTYGAIVCILVYSMIPIEIIQDGNIVNILAHIVGFITGIITACTVAMRTVYSASAPP